MLLLDAQTCLITFNGIPNSRINCDDVLGSIPANVIEINLSGRTINA